MSGDANLYRRLSAGFDADACAIELADGRRLRYADVERESARAANALVGLGLGRGERVSVLAEKSLAFVWLYLGCLRAGLVFHPLNPSYTGAELAFFLGNAGAAALVHDPALESRVAAVSAEAPALRHRLTLDADGGGSFAAACARAPATFDDAAMAGDDSAALLYSSGTTGVPKGIRITHDNLFANARALARAWAFSSTDVLLHALPLYHVHGLFITLNPALLAGTTLRLLPRFDAAAVVEALPGATVMAGVPTYYTRLLAHPDFDRACCRDVRVFISGSAPLSEATFGAFEQRTGERILERYGMTETGIITSNPLDGPRKPGAVGPPLEGVEVRVVDGNHAPVATGAIGDIEVRGPSVFPGYWELPEATAQAFDADGWFETGDQGLLDEDGYLHIVGRSKDMIISGGLNVYPKEIERELERLDGVAEAAVFGVGHADLGEAVVAAAVCRAGASLDEQAAIAALKHTLAGYKVPKRVLSVEELPRNTMGKVQKNRLRERFARLFDGAQ